MNIRFSYICLVPYLLGACLLFSVRATAAVLPSQQVHDLNGTVHSIPDQSAKATVLIFIAHDCPISCAMLPEVERIRRAYPQIPFYVVYAEPGFTTAQAKVHVKQYSIGSTCILSGWKKLVKWSNARVTPEAMVIGKSGDVLYQGRIDDKYAGLGIYRASATTHELRDALDEVSHGQDIKISKTTAVGCTIETMLLRGNG